MKSKVTGCGDEESGENGFIPLLRLSALRRHISSRNNRELSVAGCLSLDFYLETYSTTSFPFNGKDKD